MTELLGPNFYDNLEALVRPTGLPARREPRIIDYAPPAVRTPPIPMPTYVEHRDGVDDVGRLSASAVVLSYEQAAKEIEAMGEELSARIKRLEDTKAEAILTMEEIKDTAAAYRDAGKRIFLEIEDCSLMNAEVRKTCGELKDKIAGPGG